jgi:hypothetical protein
MGELSLVSRNRKSFNSQYPYIIEALSDLPENTVVDGEVVALHDSGRPDFNLLQHYRTQRLRIHYFIFDLLVYQEHDLTELALIEAFGYPRVPVRQSARDAQGTLGRRTDGGRHGKVRVGTTQASRAD